MVNFALHRFILKTKSKAALVAGIVGNLATLAYFKYADFLISNINLLGGTELPALGIYCTECRAEPGMPCRADDDPMRPRLSPHDARERSVRPRVASA